MFGAFAINVDTTIVNIAIPDIERGLNATFNQMLWVINGYTVVFAVLLVTTGRLGDMYGPKKLTIFGFVLFTLGSTASAAAPTASSLIACRVLQGIGAGILTPQAIPIFEHIFDKNRQDLAFGIWISIIGIAAAVGPALGGYLVTVLSWRWIFLVNLPVGVITVISCYLLCPELRRPVHIRLDIAGAILSAAMLFLVVFALIESQIYNWGPISSVGAFSLGPTRWGLLSIYSFLFYAAILTGLFVWVQARAPQAILPLSLFRNRNFSAGNLVVLTLNFTVVGLPLVISLFLQSILGFSAIHAGLTFLPQALGLTLAAPAAGRVAARIGNKPVVVFGVACLALATTWITVTLDLGATSLQLIAPLAVFGIGFGCTVTAAIPAALSHIPEDEDGSASAVINTTRFIGALVGTAVAGAVLTRQVALALPSQAHRLAAQVPHSFRSAFLATWRAASQHAQRFGKGQPEGAYIPRGTPHAIAQHIAAANHDVFASAFVAGMRPVLVLFSLAAALAVVLSISMRRDRRPRPRTREEPEPEVAAATAHSS